MPDVRAAATAEDLQARERAAQREMPLWNPSSSFEETLRDSIFRRLGATLDLLQDNVMLVGLGLPSAGQQSLAGSFVSLADKSAPSPALTNFTRARVAI